MTGDLVCRLVAVQEPDGHYGWQNRVAYRYDGQTWRIVTEKYSDGKPQETRDLYYSSAWQVIEERIAGTAIDQFLWNPAYVDALVLRYINSSRAIYTLQDANWDVVATTDERDLGVIESRYAYEPFGHVEYLQSDFTPAGENGWVYLFQGGRLDATVGLTQFRYRDLMMAIGRWLGPPLSGINSFAI